MHSANRRRRRIEHVHLIGYSNVGLAVGTVRHGAAVAQLCRMRPVGNLGAVIRLAVCSELRRLHAVGDRVVGATFRPSFPHQPDDRYDDDHHHNDGDDGDNDECDNNGDISHGGGARRSFGGVPWRAYSVTYYVGKM